MLTLHTYRFLGDHSTLSIHECAGRGRVFIRMEGDITRGEEFALFLNSEQWSRLCAFDPFDDYDRAVQDVIRELTFRESEEGDFLSITQVADRDVVHLLMHKDVAVHEDDILAIALDRSEWHRLATLDLLSPGELGTGPTTWSGNGPTHTIH
jgi:hypothetical protein